MLKWTPIVLILPHWNYNPLENNSSFPSKLKNSSKYFKTINLSSELSSWSPSAFLLWYGFQAPHHPGLAPQDTVPIIRILNKVWLPTDPDKMSQISRSSACQLISHHKHQSKLGESWASQLTLAEYFKCLESVNFIFALTVRCETSNWNDVIHMANANTNYLTTESGVGMLRHIKKVNHPFYQILIN